MDDTTDPDTGCQSDTKNASSLSDSSALGAIKFCESLHSRKGSSSLTPSSSSSSLTRLSVMSYNVFFHPRQGQDRDARRKHLLDSLKTFESTFQLPVPDVIAFQEVDDAFLDSEGLKALYPYRTKRVLMNAIASKYPIVDFKTFEAQPGNMLATIDVSKKDRCGLLRCVCASKRVHLLNVHLYAGDFNSGHNRRVNEYGQLKKWISSMDIPKSEPVIVAGDFNDETDDLRDMKEWVVDYDQATTGTFVDGKYKVGSWSSRANTLVALHFQSRYNYYPKGYTKTIDYVGYDKRFLAPVECGGEMRVLLMKSRRPWKYACEGPSPWCDNPAMQHLEGKWEASTWFEAKAGVEKLFHGCMEKGDDFYDELSDHFPVYQQFTFKM